MIIRMRSEEVTANFNECRDSFQNVLDYVRSPQSSLFFVIVEHVESARIEALKIMIRVPVLLFLP